MINARYNNTTCNGNCRRPVRKLGFWEFCLGCVGIGAAVKITRMIVDKNFVIDEAAEGAKACIYKLYESDKLSQVVKARKKTVEFLDLFDAFTEKELLESMGVAVLENEEVNKIFDTTSKFTVKRTKEGKYCLYATPPKEVEDDEFGDEDIYKEEV